MLDGLLRRAFVVAAAAWALSLPAATWAAGVHPPARPWYGLAALIYGAGRILCHQLPQRSFHLWTMQMPVCARCTGLYAGGALAAVAAAAAPRGEPVHARALLIVSAVPTIVTLVVEWATGQMPANTIRALAAVPFGAAVAWIVASGAGRHGERPCGARPPKRGETR